jgi:glycosyltransferase involved in cell wall biosynthesis
MPLPRITIVTPSFNQAHFLEQTIQSVLDQQYPNLQYIICDGGSTDQSVEIIRKYERHLSYWCSEKDRGQGHAINKGFARGDGELFAYINSDDYFLPDALRTAADVFSSGAEFIVGHSQFLHRNGSSSAFNVQPHAQPSDWLIANPIPQQSTFWSARLWKRLGEFREDLNFSFDYEYWVRIRFRGNLQPHVIDKTLAVFRMHAASKTLSAKDPFEHDNDLIRREYLRFLPPAERRKVRTTVRQTKAAASQKAAWAALKQRDLSAARKLALTAVSNALTSIDSWRLMYCALRGR